jgi:glycerol-3-phosphate dehydrogenase
MCSSWEVFARLRPRTPSSALIVCAGGATGTGVALDATTRGLRVALVEADDFASGTSSRSTKLIHGGVRYLEKAVKQLDYGQLKLVFEALHERSHLLAAAPHLTNALPTVMPCYKWWEASPRVNVSRCRRLAHAACRCPTSGWA